MFKYLPLFFLLTVLSGTVNGQDPVFSQFYAAPLQLNPAFAGNTYAPRIALNYRNQWPSLNQAYITYAASYDQFLEPLNSGFGLMALSDDSGDGIFVTNKFSAIYAYRLQINKSAFAKIGVEGSLTQRRLDWNKLVFFDQLNPLYGSTDPGGNPNLSQEVPPDNLQQNYFDLGIGFLAYGPLFYGGLSLRHINRPDDDLLNVNTGLESGLPMLVSVHGGAQIVLSENNKRKEGAFLSPNVMYVRQGDFSQINAGAYAGFGLLFAGVWYRHTPSNGDAAILLAGVKKGVFKIGYSYDLTISGLAGKTGGSHEVSLILNFDANQPKTTDYNDCFGLFR